MTHSPYTRNINIPDDLWRAAKIEAVRTETSATDIVNRALRFYLTNTRQAREEEIDRIRRGVLTD